MIEQMREAMGQVPTWNWALQAVGLITAYVGAELNARMRVEGFYVWLVSNLVLGILHALSSLWLLLLLDILFLRVNALGVLHWKRRGKASDTGGKVPKDPAISRGSCQ